MIKPAISVLLPIYNCELYLEEAISSVLSQTFEDFEIIAIDDGSSDQSLKLIRKYADQDRRIKAFTQNNKGIVSTLNRALFNAAGHYCVRMDGDDITHKERFERLKNYLDANPDTVVIGTQGYILDTSGRFVKPLVVKTNNSDIQNSLLYTQNRDGIIHPSTMFRTAVAKKIGGYREEYIYAEDLDFFLRMGEHGLIENLEECLYFYRQHLSSISITKREVQRENALFAISDACERRSISITHSNYQTLSNQVESEVDFLLGLAMQASLHGHKKTALINCKNAIAKDPFNLFAWKVFIISTFPTLVVQQLRRARNILKGNFKNSDEPQALQ